MGKLLLELLKFILSGVKWFYHKAQMTWADSKFTIYEESHVKTKYIHGNSGQNQDTETCNMLD